MNEPDQDQRLSRIATQWSVLLDAQGSRATLAQTARSKLAQRYLPAAYRYLLAMVRDEDVADELCQRLALKFLEGKFQNVSPQRGLFRNYLKTTIVNLVRTYQRELGKLPQPISDDLGGDHVPADDPGEEAAFRREWQSEVLELTWATLKRERENYYRVLRLRIEMPNHSSAQLAEEYENLYSETISAANIRKIQERAHTKFADLLIDEVVLSLEQAEPEMVRAELIELDLFKYCKVAFERWSAKYGSKD